ncbi:translation initiation factor IF-2-like [Aquila chrysaetos chrysaetos]|uniref:translation initiation factor IF-2-like n=1 Tax=Aquila chrysaetos chrysaetos TaxID=223781 RepID=UPI001176DDF5|nr:translation initiation factor IF-2-like [Aquila chrysaetos chrysaetos]
MDPSGDTSFMLAAPFPEYQLQTASGRRSRQSPEQDAGGFHPASAEKRSPQPGPGSAQLPPPPPPPAFGSRDPCAGPGPPRALPAPGQRPEPRRISAAERSPTGAFCPRLRGNASSQVGLRPGPAAARAPSPQHPTAGRSGPGNPPPAGRPGPGTPPPGGRPAGPRHPTSRRPAGRLLPLNVSVLTSLTPWEPPLRPPLRGWEGAGARDGPLPGGDRSPPEDTPGGERELVSCSSRRAVSGEASSGNGKWASKRQIEADREVPEVQERRGRAGGPVHSRRLSRERRTRRGRCRGQPREI